MNVPPMIVTHLGFYFKVLFVIYITFEHMPKLMSGTWAVIVRAYWCDFTFIKSIITPDFKWKSFQYGDPNIFKTFVTFFHFMAHKVKRHIMDGCACLNLKVVINILPAPVTTKWCHLENINFWWGIKTSHISRKSNVNKTYNNWCIKGN